MVRLFFAQGEQGNNWYFRVIPAPPAIPSGGEKNGKNYSVDLEYDASGTKRAKQTKTDGSPLSQTNYIAKLCMKTTNSSLYSLPKAAL